MCAPGRIEFQAMKKLMYLWAFTILPLLVLAQDSIKHRLVFIGESPGKLPNELWKHATGNILRGRTTVIYLDDNKYLLGEIKTGSKDETRLKTILRNQLQEIRNNGASAYFVSANEAWNKLTAGHREKKISDQEIIDSLFHLPTGNRCPDPIEIAITDQLTIIFFNSNWWLSPINIALADDSCDCKTKTDVLDRLDELRYRNSGKQIMLISPHPFQSYGVYGNKSTWKDHLFPLTAANKNLYVPLPGVGSVYRFLRSTMASPNNSKHPLYRDMIFQVDEVMADFPNLVHVSGHEKGLQLTSGPYIQVVTGPGAKQKAAQKGKHSEFADTHPGYALADLYSDSTLRFTFVNYKKGKTQPVFTRTVPYKEILEADTANLTAIAGDSITVSLHPSYSRVGKFHRFLFGENYREEWSAPVTLPVLRISKMQGGLVPLKRGGGMQSKSLRLADKNEKEWVIRSVEKSPDALLPQNFRQTFVRDWIDDATSAQHPFGALVVPPIANAVGIPHASPIIGVVAPDTNLGIHGRVFANMVALFEEREPLGDSDNSEKMKKNLQEDNDNRIKATEFLRARMLDMLLGDWDRHEDQWRWKDLTKGKTKTYLGVPRDRDQVFHVTQGIIPAIASKDYVLPTLRDFDPEIEKVNWVLFKTRFVNAYPEFQFSFDAWMHEAQAFKKLVTDSVLEAALKRLPPPAYNLRHNVLFKTLVSRRDRIPVAMDKYYRFIQKIADIESSDKNEWVQVSDAGNGALNVRISKISKSGKIEDELMNKNFDPHLTKEIRIYTNDGNDSITVNNTSSSIKLRLIGGNDRKSYNVLAAKKSVHIYNKPTASVFSGDLSRVRKHISNDSLNTSFIPVNLYNVWMPLFVAGLNIDDGFIIGAGFKFTKQEGFRKIPHASTHQLLANYAFATGAYRLRYNGEWIHVIDKTDITVQALAKAPNNTINFFGRGNETAFNKTGDYKRFYRTRFSTFQLDPAFRWRQKMSALSIGPSLYYYTFDKDDNSGRFITHTSLIGSYDSAVVDKSKLHLGVAVQFSRDSRNNRIFPQWGSYVNVRLQAYQAIGNFARSFAQLIPEIAFYKSLTRRCTVVLAERMGGVIGFGHAAFYQSAFIGGHENLFGYRQYRFAGQHSIYNNLELRVRLADVASYIVPGQFGITGFWDIGRVWEKHDNSGKWHSGTGGGIYFAPASVIAFSFVVGHSTEGWYPYFTMGLRF